MAEDRESITTLYGKINPWQTRILRLHPRSTDSTLRADLLVADIVHLSGLVLHHEQIRVEYSAISYTWGKPAFNHGAVINGKEIAITASLHDALHCSRSSGIIQVQPQYIWADALCIDQCNDSEKSFQVKNMFTIFSKARTVIGWLGQANERVDKAIDFLRSPKTLRFVRGLQDGCTDAQSMRSGITPQQYLASRGSPEAMKGLQSLATTPWISRAWIQQEIFAANHIRLFCGRAELSLQEFKSIALFLEHLEAGDGRIDGGLSGMLLRNIAILRHAHQSSPSQASQLSDQGGGSTYGF